jgi:hypothetical protein
MRKINDEHGSLEDLNRQVAQWLATINIKAGLVPDKTFDPEMHLPTNRGKEVSDAPDRA